ncbi:hypothetical protein WG622_18050 [Cognatishimia sp. D5M38]|uniref:DUF1640 domain-containing protein n=1 Tax=Cognatishimia coralii TaxID=3083254 RepID=A0ABU8QL45_9RHOB
MAQAMQIDTLKASNTLQDAGFDKKQADAIVQTMSSADASGFATKADIKVEISDAKSEILKWMFGALAGQTALLIAVIRLF